MQLNEQDLAQLFKTAEDATTALEGMTNALNGINASLAHLNEAIIEVADNEITWRRDT